MKIDALGANQHTDEVDAGRPYLTGKLVDLTPFGMINRIDGILVLTHGSHLDRDPLGTVHRQNVDFTLADHDIGPNNFHAVTRQKLRGQLLAEPTKTPP